jgi:D-amino-acid dehydrogenase
LSCCLRPTAPDDKPIIGPLKFYPNVYLNAGHSGRGTTIGLSTSKIVSDLIESGKSEDCKNLSPFSPRRFNLWLTV